MRIFFVKLSYIHFASSSCNDGQNHKNVLQVTWWRIVTMSFVLVYQFYFYMPHHMRSVFFTTIMHNNIESGQIRRNPWIQVQETDGRLFLLNLDYTLVEATWMMWINFFLHSHKKRNSLETRAVLLIFLLEFEIYGVTVQGIHQSSGCSFKNKGTKSKVTF